MCVCSRDEPVYLHIEQVVRCDHKWSHVTFCDIYIYVKFLFGLLCSYSVFELCTKATRNAFTAGGRNEVQI